MSEQPRIDASQALIDLIFVGITYGIDALRDGAGTFGPVVLMNDHKGERMSPILIGTEQMEDAVTEAHVMVGELSEKLGEKLSMYVIIADAFITIQGQKFDAVLVEGGERGKPFALRFAQRYKPAADGAPLEVIGNPAYVGQVEQGLRG